MNLSSLHPAPVGNMLPKLRHPRYVHPGFSRQENAWFSTIDKLSPASDYPAHYKKSPRMKLFPTFAPPFPEKEPKRHQGQPCQLNASYVKGRSREVIMPDGVISNLGNFHRYSLGNKSAVQSVWRPDWRSTLLLYSQWSFNNKSARKHSPVTLLLQEIFSFQNF
jgi:hypothetical protein